MNLLSEGLELFTRKGEELKDRIFNAPEIASLVRQATNNEHWGPAGTLMAQIADASEQFQNCQIIMSTLWERFSEKPTLGFGSNWRNMYKALLLLDYLIKNGSERIVNEARQNMMELKELCRYNHIDDHGTDRGLSIRERAKQIVDLLNDTKRLRTERKRAKASRGKFEASISSGSDLYDARRRRNSRNSPRWDEYDRKSNNNRGGSMGYADSSGEEDVSDEEFVIRKAPSKEKQNPTSETNFFNQQQQQPQEDDWADFARAPSNPGVTSQTATQSLNGFQSSQSFSVPTQTSGADLSTLNMHSFSTAPAFGANLPQITPVGPSLTPTLGVIVQSNDLSLNSAPPSGLSKSESQRSNDPWAKSHLFDLSSISAPKTDAFSSTSASPKPLGATLSTPYTPQSATHSYNHNNPNTPFATPYQQQSTPYGVPVGTTVGSNYSAHPGTYTSATYSTYPTPASGWH